MSDTLNKARIVAAVGSIVTAIAADAQVRLFVSGPSANNTTPTLDDFVEPEGTWYDPEDEEHPVAVYGDPFENAGGEIEVRCASVQFDFITAEGNEPVDIAGWMVVGGDESEVFHFGYLPEAVHLSGNLSAVIVQPGFSLPIPTGA